MRFSIEVAGRLLGLLCAVTFICAAKGADDDDDKKIPQVTTNADGSTSTRYGLFDWLDRASVYREEIFPEPFLVEDMAYEDTELELTWQHNKNSRETSDVGTAEIQKSIGLLTLEFQVPYESDVSPNESARGVGNLELGARYPVYQFVSPKRFVDLTLGAAAEGAAPLSSAVSRNSEVTPEVFGDLCLGNHLTLQSVFGYSMEFGGGDDGGARSFEYGLSFGYVIPHLELPLPGVQDIIPMWELLGETGLNKDESGQNSLLSDVGFRVRLNRINILQPGFGMAYVFPLNNVAKQETRWGVIVSVIFDF